MNDMPMPELVKDPEFTDLIQPRNTQYMEELEEDNRQEQYTHIYKLNIKHRISS